VGHLSACSTPISISEELYLYCQNEKKINSTSDCETIQSYVLSLQFYVVNFYSEPSFYNPSTLLINDSFTTYIIKLSIQIYRTGRLRYMSDWNKWRYLRSC
jgi:hypothetical protein